jgi:chromate transporter
MKDYLTLLACFFKMGCLTFGGGYSMLPVLEKELVNQRGWTTMEEILDCYALGQMTPGVIAVNVSTFIGYKRRGVAGGILCTLGFVCPSLIIIILIATFLQNFAHLEVVQHAFAGIRVAVGALILSTVLRLLRDLGKGGRRVPSVLLCTAVFVLSAVFKTSPVLLTLAAGLSGFLLFPTKQAGEK